jgi:hypothetical protein
MLGLFSAGFRLRTSRLRIKLRRARGFGGQVFCRVYFWLFVGFVLLRDLRTRSGRSGGRSSETGLLIAGLVDKVNIYFWEILTTNRHE